MPLCTVCGEESETVTKCKICGAKYCSDCGEHDDKTCIYCFDEDEEDENWNTEWDEDKDWDDE
jgi:hypothetical protein